jgi:hypothetical protein
MRGNDVETRRDRTSLAQDAGMRKVSWLSVLAGTLVAYGCFAVLVAIAAAIGKGTGFDTDLSGGEWRDLGIAGGAAIACLQLVSYFFGGYVAGRMSRRSGALNGFLVFVLGVVLAVGVAGIVTMFTDSGEVTRNLRNIGIPTSSDEWQQIGTFAGIGSLAAMWLGSMLGGSAGERWHGRLMRRAMDPTVGTGIPMTGPARTTGNAIIDDGTSTMDRRDGASTMERRDGTSTMERRDGHIDIRDRDRDGDGDRETTLDEDRERQHHRSDV